MKVVIFQPPVTQLNTPYPSGAYLSSFFKHEQSIFPHIESVTWYDLSNSLFHSVFSKQGLQKLFTLSTEKALSLAAKADKKGDEATSFNLRRYISESDNWINTIDTIIAITCNNSTFSARELCHEFVRSPYTPRGSRMEQYLSTINRDVTADDARILASLALADLSDYISTVFDSHFSLVRYAESLACSTSDFSQVVQSLDSPILHHYLQPLVCSIIEQLFLTSDVNTKVQLSCDKTKSKRNLLNDKLQSTNASVEYLFCISVPFPGTFTAALSIAKILRENFPENSLISIGGGYVNTELRNVSESNLFSFTDILSYDRGYGSYHQLLSSGLGLSNVSKEQLFSSIGKIRFNQNGVIIPQKEYDKQTIDYEDTLTRTLIPDYSSIDFSEYPRLADDYNPMHRLWSDGSWLKAFLAHGCYWHRCTFCDNTLDYVCNYKMVDVRSLYNGLLTQSQKTSIRGIHFTDEAAPPYALQVFAEENCRYHRPLTFWGNIRFEKVFTRDLTDFLAYSGLTGVSGGLESATPSGLEAVNKGIEMEHIVSACAAFKESGVLVHAYMIFGYWQETPQELINSLETLRQMFIAGLLDSTFFHKFTLTRHSGAFASWQQGKLSSLHPLITTSNGSKPPFAENDLRFTGEEKSAIYSDGLNTAVENWMHGNGLNKPVHKWFAFKMPQPTIESNYIDNLIQKYEKQRDNEYAQPQQTTSRYLWLGGKPIVCKNKLLWMYMGEMNELQLKTPTDAENIAMQLLALQPETVLQTEQPFSQKNTPLPKDVFLAVRGAGLIKL